MEDFQFERLIEALDRISYSFDEAKFADPQTKMGWPQATRLIGWYALLAFTVYLIFLATS